MFRSVSTLRWTVMLLIAACFGFLTGCGAPDTSAFVTPPAAREGAIVMRVAAASDEDPVAAGRTAAADLRRQMGATPLRAVIVVECFEEESLKSKVLKGVSSVLGRDILFGCSTYGSFGQGGCLDTDSVCLLGIGGEGISIGAVLEKDLGVAGLTMESDKEQLVSRLQNAGADLARKLPRTPRDRLVIVLPDAHSPKNEPLAEGVRSVMGNAFPITGGSANKNAGQTFVYFRGRMFEDSAVALILSGDFKVSLAGRQAKSNEKVISSARDCAAEALENLRGRPFAMLAFNCAGRKGRLDNVEDELKAIQGAVGKRLPLFGCYCAGEIGPADLAEKKRGVLSSGAGWHIMCTAFGRD